jgi:predicted RNA-binding protein with PUA-like domain
MISNPWLETQANKNTTNSPIINYKQFIKTRPDPSVLIMLSGMKHWLIKSEPDVFSIDDLQRVGREPWNGVRNYQARNFMRDLMKPGDLALFYHSNATPPGVVGVAKVAGAPYPDETQFDPASEYYDPKATRENPRWVLVDFEFVAKFKHPVTLQEMKEDPKLDGMVVLQKGTRLSITPVEKAHFERLCKRGGWT